MIKSELIEKLALKMTNIPEKDISDAVNFILKILSDALIKGDRIEIRGFGSFAPKKRRPRKAHNPKTGEKVITQEKKGVHFKPGKEMRERINAARTRCPIH